MQLYRTPRSKDEGHILQRVRSVISFNFWLDFDFLLLHCFFYGHNTFLSIGEVSHFHVFSLFLIGNVKMFCFCSGTWLLFTMQSLFAFSMIISCCRFFAALSFPPWVDLFDIEQHRYKQRKQLKLKLQLLGTYESIHAYSTWWI